MRARERESEREQNEEGKRISATWSWGCGQPSGKASISHGIIPESHISGNERPGGPALWAEAGKDTLLWLTPASSHKASPAPPQTQGSVCSRAETRPRTEVCLIVYITPSSQATEERNRHTSKTAFLVQK